MTKVGKTVFGCLGMLGVWAAAAIALHVWLGGRVVDDVRPFAAAGAGLFATLSVFSVWTIVSGDTRGDKSRSAILERAESGRLPTQDGIAAYRGTTRPAGGTLTAPISGTPCVAYFYRMYEEVYDSANKRNSIPHYWGFGCVPFFIDTRGSAVRVLAMPAIEGEETPYDDAASIARAQRWITSQPFENAAGIGGLFATVYEIASDLFTEHGEQRRNFRRTDTQRSAASLRLEESVVPVGVTAAVSGAWSMRHNGIVPGSAIEDESGTGVGVRIAIGDLASLTGANSAVPTSAAYNIGFAIVTAAIGAGIVWAALVHAAPAQ